MLKEIKGDESRLGDVEAEEERKREMRRQGVCFKIRLKRGRNR